MILGLVPSDDSFWSEFNLILVLVPGELSLGDFVKFWFSLGLVLVQTLFCLGFSPGFVLFDCHRSKITPNEKQSHKMKKIKRHKEEKTQKRPRCVSVSASS